MRTVITGLACFLAGVTLYPAFISVLVRAGAGQKIQDFNPATHRVKSGTPTMGGILFCLIAVVAWAVADRGRAGFVIAYALVAGAVVGLLDDLVNVRGLLDLGLRARQKLALQALVGVLVGVAVDILKESAQYIPGVGLVDLGWLIVPLCAAAVVAATNAVNLTDGVDGLAGLCVVVALVGTASIGLHIADDSATVLSIALAGSVAAFLVYNWYPARVFMGDTGSLALGAALTAISVELHLLWLLPLLGIVFVAETLSVIINVTAIRRFGRRVFRASPLHHHFEELGLREERLVLAFAVAGAMAMLLTVVLAHGLSVTHGVVP
jgi:phospho-N-acetylmuramoyl-pentapeptide-transferase